MVTGPNITRSWLCYSKTHENNVPLHRGDPRHRCEHHLRQRNLEYDTMSGKYSDFVETEVLPMAEKVANVKLTKDPDGRAVMGTSSGAAAGMIMAWFHPERYRRVLTFSGTFTNNQWPTDPEHPHGAWGLHEKLIPNSAVKPLRIYMEVGDRDNYSAQDPMRDWVEANENMARVLAA
ncbi:MAG: alpha/beta hydrolase-fold protein, partial [Opitutaceae bacterium]